VSLAGAEKAWDSPVDSHVNMSNLKRSNYYLLSMAIHQNHIRMSS
jgi:hypothetical protein